jgi:hypothetical protein
MSKLALTVIAALVILLLGAGVVLAQGTTAFNGGGMRGMMNTTDQTTPGDGTQGPGMMGNGGGGMMGDGNGMMGNTDGTGMMGDGGSMMNTENQQRMRDAMNSGNWDEMTNICKDAINSQTTPAAPQTSAPAGNTNGTTTGRTTGTSAPRTTSSTRSGVMMGTRI